MDDYLAKPVRKDDLKAAIDRWVTKSAFSTPLQQEESENIGPLPLFDEAEMSERLDHDQDFIRMILDEALQELPTRCEELCEQLKGDNVTTIRHQAHTLKGVAANISAEALRDICFKIESAVKEGGAGLEAARELLSNLERIVAKTILAIGKS